MAELKPCPFCGHIPVRSTFGKADGIYWYIACTNERCRITPCTALYKAKGADIKAWNRRIKNNE